MKLRKLLSIAILLTGINWNACFAEPAGRMVLYPKRYKCLELLELERVKVDPQTAIMTSDDLQLVSDYNAVASWLLGFFTAWNFNKDTDGDVTKRATSYQMMAWVLVFVGRTHQQT
jgi:hypothetical protein